MKSIWKKTVALLLAVLMTAGVLITAGADTVAGDLNGDGKITVFDAQLLLEVKSGLRTLEGIGELTLADVVKTVLGGMPDAMDTDGDGVIEIYAASGLRRLNSEPDGSFILMNDIDLAGSRWQPVAKFTGCFDGNGKTISNVNISGSVSGLYTTNPTPINQGFFGDTGPTAVIRDLNLRNVTVTVAEESVYVGLFVGSNRGKIENCTVTGTIIDTREAYDQNIYVGAAAGRICSPGASGVVGSFEGGTNVSVTDDAGRYTTEGLCADVKLQITARDQVNRKNKIGLVGWMPSGAAVTGKFAESTYETDTLSDTVQKNRATVIEYMNAMGTVEWIPSETLVYKSSSGIGNKTFRAGQTYTGLPYTGCNGSMERFVSAMNPDGTTKSGLGDSIWSDETGYTGFATLMGNVCTTSIGYAWMRVSGNQVAPEESYTNPYRGGVYVNSTLTMIPTPAHRATYGVYAVGDWEQFWTVDENGREVEAPYNEALEAYHCTDEVYTVQILERNGADTILEAYAKTYGGDAIITRCENYAATVGVSGHARMIVADPVVIRNADGTIDQDSSYLITTEQGASTGAYSSWRVNYRYSFRTLLDDPADSAASDYMHTYIPVTMRALHDEKVRASYVTIYPGENAVTAPDKGKIFSNFRVLSTTVTVRNGDSVIYSGEIFTGTESKHHTGKFNTVDISCHSEAFRAAAQAAGLETGSYQFDLLVTTGDGKTHTRVKNMEFEYTAEA